ncbi:PepSY domain-containing protein [Vagococcus salmoninarum]|uniref:PepSY domain-containing protein n=1 Tax=Vagococcus salmoninarum TaxID=2739 RepID=A0A429ZKV7_9ENTE|nr:PepSY domain-containing protein [Vagococcus salmoninarum]RST94347.1 hypothetical protein CBF35_10270 [Vagococcus salmoninarum]
MKKAQRQLLEATLVLGIGTGIVLGGLATNWVIKRQTVSPDKVLAKVKKAFLAEGPIEGAWIEFTKTPLQKFAIKSQTYTGGITRIEDGEYIQYEFVADSQTGTILDIYRLTKTS